VLDSALAAHHQNLSHSTTPKATVNSHQEVKKPSMRASDPVVSAAKDVVWATITSHTVAVHLQKQFQSKASTINAYNTHWKRAKIQDGVNHLITESTAADFMEILSVVNELTDRLTACKNQTNQ
jgi:hypothetical protein